MTEPHNEIHGRDIIAPVVQSGHIDHLEINVGDIPPERGHPPLTSWQDRPELTPALTDLMMAQREATQSLPYTLLGVRKPDLLNEIYVQQSLRPEAPVDRGVERERRPPAEQKVSEQAEFGERPVTVTEALNRDRHLVITGEPGAGKSTLGYMYVQRLSAHWLDAGQERPPLTEPVLPLRIQARALAGDRPWNVLLAEGVQQALGGLLANGVRPDVLAQRAMGARWLIFVDGLDEISDQGIHRQVLKAISFQMRRNLDHRLVVTTRPLADRDLDSLYRDHADHFRIQPFGQAELEEFARAWFRAQDAITAPEHAADFLRQARDSRLRDLVRNPLLATIAAITLTLRPDRPLPNNLADLYERFMSHLLTDTASGRKTISDLRRSLLDQRLRLQVFDWVTPRRDALITHLAVYRLESEDSLFEAATAWVSGRQDVVDPAELPDGWREDLHALLVGSGVFGQAKEDLSFWHHSFAEFLAARDHAASIPADFPGLDIWIDRGLSTATQRFALFTFVLWSRRGGHDIGLVLRSLLSDPDRILLAARLLAEGVEVTEELAARVIDRLVDLIVSGGIPEGSGTNAAAIRQVVAALDHHTVGTRTIDRLRRLRDQPEVTATTRIDCAAALGYLTGPADAVHWLEQFAATADLWTVSHVVDALPDLAQDGLDRAERLAVRLGGAADYVSVLTAIAILVQINREDAATPLVRGLVSRLRQDPGITPETPVMPARPTTAAVRLRVRDARQEVVLTWSQLAGLAISAGCPDEALWAARRSLALPQTTDEDLSEAVTAMLAAAGAGVVGEVMTAARSRPPAQVLGIAAVLDDTEYSVPAGELARQVLADHRSTEYEIGNAVELFLTSAAGSTDEALSIIRERGGPTRELQLALATALAEADVPDVAGRILHELVDDPASKPFEFGEAAQVLLDHGDATAAEDVFLAAVARSTEHCARAAPLLANAGREDLAHELLQRVLDSPTSFEVLADMADSFRSDGRHDLLAAIIEVALPLADQADSVYDIDNLLQALAAVGRADEATALARSAFVRETTAGHGLRDMTGYWLQLGGESSGADIVAEVLAADISAERRMQIAGELATAGLLADAASVWLDVVRWHGDTVDQGIAAASRLAACGYRNRVIEMVTGALSDTSLSPVTRAGLRAVLAWTVFNSPDATTEELRSLLGE
jgi:hypothetical protein